MDDTNTGYLGYTHSDKDPGTLKQLQTLIARTNVPHTPTKNVNAAEDFLQVYMTCSFMSTTCSHASIL